MMRFKLPKLPQLPVVSRAVFNMAIANADRAHAEARSALDRLRVAELRAEQAETRARESFAAALAALAQARDTVRDAHTFSKSITERVTASFLGPTGDDAEGGAGTSVRDADRQAARRARDQANDEATARGRR